MLAGLHSSSHFIAYSVLLITGYHLRLTYMSELLISTVLSPLITGNVNSFALKVKQFVFDISRDRQILQFCTGINWT
jgi:hypothetical protein